ncbi:hypothetical protein C922_03390 [Plasmodium inui San Antonio 1]|uniref:Uncharacterized protein n=1 Tax=Plasmodium inui San Antonio 1 TaxID=1237626 RepID=W7A3G7_9APIC|nr:hypothetical protein C922_03390 [Plasmodium inui San Antonio 1]EUD66195.1 hypothetical protein C922_03390 [Plasmodium inui San Antonio 1]
MEMLPRNRGEACHPRMREAQGGTVCMELADPRCEDEFGREECIKHECMKKDYMKDTCMKDICVKDVTGEERARAITATMRASPSSCQWEGSLEGVPPLLLPQSSPRTEPPSDIPTHVIISPMRHPSPQLSTEYQMKELTLLMEKYDVRRNFVCFGGAFARFANETYTFTHRHFRPHLGIHMNAYFFNHFIFMKNHIKMIHFSRWHILVYLSDNRLYVYKHSRYLWHLDHFNEWKHLPLPTSNEIKDIQIVSCNYKGDLYFDHPKGPDYDLNDDTQFGSSTHQHETIDPIHFFGLSLIDSKDNLYLGLNTNVNSSRINIKQMKMIVPRSFEKRRLRMRTILVSLPELSEYDLRSCAVYLKYASIFELSYTRAGKRNGGNGSGENGNRGNDRGGRRVSCVNQGITTPGQASNGKHSGEAATLHVENTPHGMDTYQSSKVDYRKGSKERGRSSQPGRLSQMVRASPKGKNKKRISESESPSCGSKLSTSVKAEEENRNQEENRAADPLDCAVGEVKRGEDHHDNPTQDRAKKRRRINRGKAGRPPGQLPQSGSSSDVGRATGGRGAEGGSNKGGRATGGTINPCKMDAPRMERHFERVTKKKDHFIFIKTSNNLKFKKRLIRSKPKVLLSGTSCAHGCVLFENKEIYFWIFGQGESPLPEAVHADEVVASTEFAALKGRQSKRFTFKKLEYPKLNIVDVVYCNNTYIMLSEDNILFILKTPYLHTLRAVNFFFYLNNYLPKGVTPHRRSGVLTLDKIRDSSLVKMYLTDYILVTVHSSKDICFTPVLFHSVYSDMDSQYIDVLSTKYEQQVKSSPRDGDAT